MSEGTTEKQRKELLRDLIGQNVGLLAEINRIRAELETVKKERDDARKAAELWRDVVNLRAPPCPRGARRFTWEDEG